MRTFSHQLAYLIVVAVPLAGVFLLRSTVQWARWVAAAAGVLGIAGLALVGLAAANLGVARTCATVHGPNGQVVKETNRPFISLFLGGDDCYGEALGQFQIVGVLFVGLSAVAVRRSASNGRPSLPGARPA